MCYHQFSLGSSAERAFQGLMALEEYGNTGKRVTFSFIVLWFFFVFFRNCFKLPEDMYSVMKITCGAVGHITLYLANYLTTQNENPTA